MSRNPTRTRTAFTAVTGLALGALVLGMPAGAGAQSPSTGAESYGVDDGTHITLWTRAATQARAQALVDAYNASHKNQVDLTIIDRTQDGNPDEIIKGDAGLPPN